MVVNYRKIEKVVKGFANHRRIQILDLLSVEPELTVVDIARKLHMGYENASDHIRKLAIAGLVMKRYRGTSVCHKLTHLAESVLVFCKELV